MWDADPQCNALTDSDSRPASYSDVHLPPHCYTVTDSQRDANADSCTDRDGHAHSDGQPTSYLDAYPGSHCHTFADSIGDANAIVCPVLADSRDNGAKPHNPFL